MLNLEQKNARKKRIQKLKIKDQPPETLNFPRR